MNRILLSYIGYPVSAGKFFKKALKNLGHEVIHCGPFSDGYLPWQPSVDYSAYNDKPDIVLPGNINTHPLQAVLDQTGKVDLVIQMDANFFLTGPTQTVNVVWAIDNHVAKYDLVNFDLFFGAHSWGHGSRQKNFQWLPCAYSPADHHMIPGSVREYDLVFGGVVYQHRHELLTKLSHYGRVGAIMGVLGEEYNKLYNSGKIAMCFSACGDLPMRVFENAAQGCLIFADRQRDLAKLGLRDGTHYVGFSNLEDAAEKFQKLLTEPETISRIARSGRNALSSETYEERADFILSCI